jgi:energy-coupling factor transport system substrate-specific component
MITPQILSAVLFLVTIALSLLVLEKAPLSVNGIGLVATLGTIAAVGRVAVPIVPGLQLTTFIVIVSGLSFGVTVGFSTAILAVIVSNFFLGHGPWTPFQMVAWGLCGAGSGLFDISRSRTVLMFWGGMWGLIFGWMLNIWQWIAFIDPLSFKSWIAINLVSLPMDLFHSLTNIILLGAFGVETVQALRRFNRRLTFTKLAIPTDLTTNI